MSTLVYYHIPSDRDDADHPNGFYIPKNPEEITLSDIRREFPLPGEYHFRFRVATGSGDIWMDHTDERGSVAFLNGKKIVLKVLRLSWTKTGAGKTVVPQPQTPQVPEKPVLPTKNAHNIDLFGSSPPSQRKQVTSTIPDLDLFS